MFLFVQSQAQVSADSLKRAIAEINPDSSAIGKPLGDTMKMTIGPEGGKIRSTDGLMELTFPPGALTAPTRIGIQPVESTSVVSFGNAYACTPDGIHFEKPVHLVMYYTDSVAKRTQRAIRTIEWQDDSGRWTTIEDVHADTVSRSISCEIGHFSTYTPATKFTLRPGFTRVKVKQEKLFILTISGTYPDGKRYRSGVEANAFFWPGHPVEWSVAGVIGGNDVVGHIHSFSADNMNGAIYTAPVAVPADLVTVTARYVGSLDKAVGVTALDAISVATVDIYDEYHYNFTGYDQVGHLYMIDSSTCEIEVYSSGIARIDHIHNPLPWSDWPAKVGKCSYEYPDKTGWKGMVEISGINWGVFQRTPGGLSNQPNPTTRILIDLKSTMGSSPTYKEHCPGFNKTVPSYPVSAQPVTINLELLQGTSDIKINYGPASGVNTLTQMRGNQGYSISVTHK